jgi:thiazole synthase
MAELMHCFGARPEHRVSTELAANMLRASGCVHLAVNTHPVDEVRRGDDLPVGYASATLGSVRDLVGAELGLRPVLNINHPTTAAAAVRRARRAVEMTGITVIKLEVLDPSFTTSSNEQVVDAAGELRADGLEVWPLITPDTWAFEQCVSLGVTVLRVMGSPIGTRRGIAPGRLPVIKELLASSPAPLMLDGGIGNTDQVAFALRLGFQSVLVNSCLFADGADPVAALRAFRAVVQQHGHRDYVARALPDTRAPARGGSDDHDRPVAAPQPATRIPSPFVLPAVLGHWGFLAAQMARKDRGA